MSGHDFTPAAEPMMTSCPPVVAPNIFRYAATHQPGEAVGVNQAQNLEPNNPMLPIPTGTATFFGGRIAVSGCDPIDLTITYIDGGGCTSGGGCTPAAALTTVQKTLTIDPNVMSAVNLPPGYWQDLTYQIDGGNGVPAAAAKAAEITVYAACQPDPCCQVNAI